MWCKYIYIYTPYIYRNKNQPNVGIPSIDATGIISSQRPTLKSEAGIPIDTIARREFQTFLVDNRSLIPKFFLAKKIETIQVPGSSKHSFFMVVSIG